jgi:hypothetical protein
MSSIVQDDAIPADFLMGWVNVAQTGFPHRRHLGVQGKSEVSSPTVGESASSGSTTPYWTTFELPAIDMKVSSVGTLDQIVAGLR